MARISIRSLLLLFYASTISLAQTKPPTVQQRADKSVCTNIVALVGNVDIKCSALTPAQQKLLASIPAILKKVLANQLDPQVVMEKLDEIQKAQANAASSPIASAPQGIAVTGGTVTNPTVNNFAPQPRLSWTEKTINAKDGKGQIELTLTVDHLLEVPAFVVQCDMPCHIINVEVRATGIFQMKEEINGRTPSVVGFVLAQPSPLAPGAPVVATIISDDARIPHVVGAIILPPEQIPPLSTPQ